MSSISLDTKPYTQLKVNRRFGRTFRLNFRDGKISKAANQREVLLSTCFTMVSCLAYFSTLEMDATCSSETSVDFQRTTGDRSLPSHSCENLKSYTVFYMSIMFRL
jgi:hypothetical protein